MTQTALLNPGAFTGDHLDPKSRELCQKTIDWFENKGLTAIKQDDMAFKWYDDFIRFQKKEGIFAHFDTCRVWRHRQLLRSKSHQYI